MSDRNAAVKIHARRIGRLSWAAVCTIVAFALPSMAKAAAADDDVAPISPAESSVRAAADGSHLPVKPEPPPLWMAAPFALLLGAIAVFPLAPKVSHWWESNLHRFYVAATLAAATLGYYAFVHAAPVQRHFLEHGLAQPSTAGPSLDIVRTVLENAILVEYIPFIALLFSLYTICGGIRIEGDLPAHPLTNATFIAVGGLLASFIGTTGAAMLLIRPLLETNSERRHTAHTIVFFIFVVCNCGGLLLPVGDPPLFLGYLRGVPFLWTLESLWAEWLFVNGLLLVIYLAWDRFVCYPRETKADIAADETGVRGLKFSGLWPNVPLLAAVVASVALLDPSQPVPGTNWSPPIYLRELVQLGLVGLSLGLGRRAVREANRFTYAAIVEVAVLFFGIFICMQPALQFLDAKGAGLGLDTAREFFWASGSLSSVLDNAPTYLVFFETAHALPVSIEAARQGADQAGVAVHLLRAISLGAVCMGAMTYIGNGPNFMVKAIAESSGVKMPSFFGYMAYSCCVLLPIFAVMAWGFL